jgi:hypothetical protein
MGDRYIIGDLHDPQPEDMLRPFETVEDAIDRAWERARCDTKRLVAVWDGDDNLLWLFTAGTQFKPV